MQRVLRLSAILLCGAALACKPSHERAYRVLGGTVTNLKGSGLVLKNKDQTLSVKDAGAFAFDTRVQQGDAYAVTVAAPPAHPNQDCTVTGGGSGTMPDTNVKSVQVGCVTKTYSVGGTVSGLKGTLVLAVSGTNTVTVEADGAFTLPQPIADGSTYTVSVQTEPSNQECTVTDGTATLDGVDVASVKVDCVDAYAVSGTLKGASGPVELQLNGVAKTVMENGQFTFPAKLKPGNEYHVTESMAPAHQKCVVSRGSGTIATEPISDIVVQCARWYEFGPFPAATFVLGQTGFANTGANQGGNAAANTLKGASGNMVVAGDHLWMSDSANNRVLGFAAAPSVNGENALLVLGQVDFTDTAARTTRAGFSGPKTIATDGTHFFVADSGNGRVLIYDMIPTSKTAVPDHVVGQVNVETHSDTCDRGTVSGAESVFVSGEKLFVADSDHNRVLIWNHIPTDDGVLPDLVLGQTDFATCTANDANGDGTADDKPSAATLSSPTDVWTDGERLLVTDTGNNRILIWNAMPTQSGQAADHVVGQSDFASVGAAVTSDHLSDPRFMASTGLQLFLAEKGSNRVLIWNTVPSGNGQWADAVVGQPDYTSSQADNDGTGNSVASAKGFDHPSGLLLQDGRLWVLDADNNRLVAFDSTY